jgi:hypothetical protein
MHVVVVNRWPRFSEARRWDNELTRYEDFIDHDGHQVSYVVDPPGRRGVLVDPSRIAALVEVDDVNDYDSLRRAVVEVTDTAGPVDQMIALSEFTLEIAARVRESLGLPGPQPDEVAVYRDKIRMKELIGAAGIRVPRFSPCRSAGDVLAFARSSGYPVIVKPVDSAGSIGVHLVDDEDALAALLPSLDLDRYEVEEFIDGTLFHIDGFADDQGGIPFMAASRYVNDCLACAGGAPLGSVVMQQSALRERIETFTRDCVSALGLRRTPFHLEVFLTPADELVFLEVGGRVGGSEVPHLLNKLFGVNLYEVWLRSLVGERVPVPAKAGDPTGGWLLIPKPDRPVRVVRADRMGERVPTIWRELVPDPGEILEPGGSYDALHSGRFIFTGDREDVIEADIHRVIKEFEMIAEPR